MVRWCVVFSVVALAACVSAADSSSSRFPDLQSQSQPEVDEMVNNLLQWIQGLYQQRNNRQARQYYGGRPEKPRPFEPPTYLPPSTGYPPSGSRPTPSYVEGPQPSQTYPPSPTYQPPNELPIYQPSQPTPQPDQPSYQPSQPSYEPSPTQPPYRPSQPIQPETEQPQPSPPYPPASKPSYQPDTPTYVPLPEQPSPSLPTEPEQPEPSKPVDIPSQPDQGGVSSNPSPIPSKPDDDDDRHPPHIHAITVDCGKEMMTINIEFNKPYNGIIYSQDHFKDSRCIYVNENSNQIKYSFTVSLNSCGTRFFSDFQNEGQAYLENVLVLQNEPGIQEVWDHIRRVRCLWEGNLTKQLVSSLSVGMLNQITSNFSGDTAMARLDIQTGRGPFAPEANGLVKIGETMTLVVSVTGDPGFDILVRECIAKDSNNAHIVPLTDSNGCILKPKLFGAFQKTRDTGNTGASIIAFAFFNAFKFPDEMDLIIQCDVELCKTDCDVCPNPGSIEPRRRRRDVVHYGYRTMEPVATLGKGLRVVFAEDLPTPDGFCMSPVAALWGSGLVFLASLLTSIIISYCWQKSRGSAKFY